MPEFAAPTVVCARCGGPLSPADLACANCGQLVHLPRLGELSQQAQMLEATNPAAAAELWRECLALLPADSQQAAILRARVAWLEAGAGGAARRRLAGSGLARTGGSMLVSMAVYGMFLGPLFAVGFVLLIWVHEMGHVLALRRYGVRSTAPLFIPFVGAVITVAPLRNAKEEAIVGIGGPVLGTMGALACFGLYLATHHGILLELSFYGFSINLLNLLPIPPLDGGRVTAALSPWIWPLGFLALVVIAVRQFVAAHYSLGGVSPVMLLILFFAAPRLWRTFRYGERWANYYKIDRASSWAIGAAYVSLGGLLLGMYFYTNRLLGG